MSKLKAPFDYKSAKMIEVGEPDANVKYARFWAGSTGEGLRIEIYDDHPGVSDRLWVKVHMSNFYCGTHEEWLASTHDRIAAKLDRLGVIEEDDCGNLEIDYRAFRQAMGIA